MSEARTIFSDTIGKRRWTRDGVTRESSHYYGRFREPGGKWQWKKLFTEKRASHKHWDELRRQNEYRASGLHRADVEKLKKPVDSLAADYHGLLKTAGRDEEHIRISKWMLDRLIELGQWRQWEDITRDSMGKILDALDKEGLTASYRNGFIKRAKAFVSAFLPDDFAHPLKKLKRIREKGQMKKRARFAASIEQITLLLQLEMPPHRLVAYALASYNGLRRNECQRLEWSDIEFDGEIPCVGIRHKQRPTDEPDVIPLHPYVGTVLFAWKQMCGRGPKVLPSVPDLKTLVKDLGRVNVPFKDSKGRRLDFHGLRHTFATNLSRYGCSRATKKKLMRHAGQDITDGYSHAELSEMFAALERIPSPQPPDYVVDSCTAPDKITDGAIEKRQSGYPTWVLGRIFETVSPLPVWIKLEDIGAGLMPSGKGSTRIKQGKARGRRKRQKPNHSQSSATARGRHMYSGRPPFPKLFPGRIQRETTAIVRGLLRRSAEQRAAAGLPPLPLPLPAGMTGGGI